MREIDRLKSEARYRHAGALAFILGFDSNYGCHFGMRSSRDFAAAEYHEGWYQAQRDCAD